MVARLPILFALVVACGVTSSAVASAEELSFPSLGGRDGEIDIDTSFVGRFGDVRPAADEATWQRADTRLFTLGVGYSAGKFGPLHDCYARVEGGALLSSAEQVEEPNGPLPVGTSFFPSDRGALVRGLLSANVLKTPRFSFGLYAEGTAPIGVDLRKYSSIRVHLVGGGTSLDVALTEPGDLLRLRYRARLFVGSGAYDGDYQHNAELRVTNLVRLEAQRWLLPWPAGIAVGPDVRADLNSYRNAVYADAYAKVLADARVGDEVQTTSVALAVMPYFHVTRHVAVEIGYAHVVTGTNLQATSTWLGTLRTTF